MKYLRQRPEEVSEMDELIHAHVRNLADVLARPHSIEELEADVAALHEIIQLFKSSNELLKGLEDGSTPDNQRAQVRRRLQRQKELITGHKEASGLMVDKSHGLIRKSAVLTMKMRERLTLMLDRPPQNFENRILARLPAPMRESFRENADHIALKRGEVLYRVDQNIEYVYFPETAVVSLLSMMENGSTVGLGLVGSEGMLGIRALSGASAVPYLAVVQRAGTALRLKAGPLKEKLEQDHSLRVLLFDYMRTVLTQIRQLAACNQLHSVEQKLVRWLLMMHDRCKSDKILLTHDLLAGLVGARRAGVSVCAASLQEAGLIDYRRGVITIRDRLRLEGAACECYGLLKQVFDHWNT